jgi:hypothetical protein
MTIDAMPVVSDRASRHAGRTFTESEQAFDSHARLVTVP